MARLTDRGHMHAEAFNLMWYGCDCGHRERYWNSRDGVTPFGSRCPSCGQPDLKHVMWNRDEYAPGHKPHFGQRVWVDMTRERAEQYADERIASMRAQGYTPKINSERLVLNIMGEHGGASPDCRIAGDWPELLGLTEKQVERLDEIWEKVT